MQKLFRIILIVSVLFSFFGRIAYAQTVNYSVHANIIYHFTKYINWPEARKSGDFIIGVVGESSILDELKKATNGKSVGNQKIVVKYFTPSENNYDCHIIFICEDESSKLKKIDLLTFNSNTLIITEGEGLAWRESCINFILVDSRTKLQINITNTEKRNLKIASELLTLGTIIK